MIPRFNFVCRVLFTLWAISPLQANAQFAQGTYLGDGLDDRVVTGVPFQADVVIIKCGGNCSTAAVARTSTMVGDVTKELTVTGALQANRIQAIGSNGFTVGSHTTVNAAGVTFHWSAWSVTGAEVAVGSYSGSGGTQSISGVGFQPALVALMPSNLDYSTFRTEAMPTNSSYRFTDGSALSNGMLSFGASGFQVGVAPEVNTSGIVYHYVAWKAVPGRMEVGSYVGDNFDNRLIPTSFGPEWVFLRADFNEESVYKPLTTGASTDTTLSLRPAPAMTNAIQQLQASGFEIGKALTVNRNGITHYWIAMAGAGTAPGPATKLSFTSPTRVFTAGGCGGTAGAITVQLQDASSTPVIAGASGQGFSVASSSTGAAEFFTDPNCATNAAGGAFTIPSGSTSVDIFYRDTASGQPVVSVTNASGLNNPAAQTHTVNPSAATELVFTVQPSNAQVGAALSPPVEVAIHDAYGNTVTDGSADITLTLDANPGGSILAGATTVATSAGVAAFTNLSLDRAGAGYRLSASSNPLLAALSAPFSVTAVEPCTACTDAGADGGQEPGRDPEGDGGLSADGGISDGTEGSCESAPNSSTCPTETDCTPESATRGLCSTGLALQVGCGCNGAPATTLFAVAALVFALRFERTRRCPGRR